ncbi:caspase domain-containing protein [Kribbella sp. NPDC050470]|uniref:caspase family protein n=1 Tax=unclassified Kribbella TaxID=2644121 RepID=UPI0037AB0795
MDGARVALVIANDQYDDPGLRRLVAPAQDAAALAEVLADPAVGGFEVQVLHNAAAQEIRFAVEDFFADRAPEDLLMLHFSCHGLKNSAGELFLAVADTKPTRLASTAVAADFVNRQMADSRAQRIALFLDCCYGGAFPRGMVVRAAGEAQVRDAFAGQAEVGGGRGRVVVTASSAMEYAFEGGQLATDASAPSVFTSAVVDGLTTGEADRDGDGWVGLTELVGYVTDRVHRVTPNQNPQMWTFGSQGELLIARSRVRRITPAQLAPELIEAMESPLPAARYGVVDYLRERLVGNDLSQAYAAWQALQPMVNDDSRRVGLAAAEALEVGVPRVTPTALDLDASGDGELRLDGPPIALTAVASPTADWLRVEQDGATIRVHADPNHPGDASVVITGPTAELTVPVRHPTPAVAPTPVAAAPAPVAATPAPVTLTMPDTESEPPPPPPEPEPGPPQPQPQPEPPHREPPSGQVPWWLIAVLVVGAALLVYLNWPGETESRKIWYDEANTGWYVYRSSGDPVILSSVAALLAALVARWSGPVALGVVAGCVASLLGDALLVLVGGIASEESTKLFGLWTNETTAWLLTGAIAAVMAAVLLTLLWPGTWPVWPVPPVPAVLAVAGGILWLASALIPHPDGISFFTVTRLAAVEPFVAAGLVWLAVAATQARTRTWITAAAATYAVIGMVAVIPALTEGDSWPVFLTVQLGSVLFLAALLSRGLRLRLRP